MSTGPLPPSLEGEGSSQRFGMWDNARRLRNGMKLMDGTHKLFVAALILLLVACSSPPPVEQTDLGADRRAVLATLDSMIVAASGADGSVQGMFAYYEDSAIWMSPNSDVDLTKETIRPFYEGLFERWTFQDLAADVHEVILSGNWAIVRLSYRGTLAPRDEGATFPLGGDRHMTLFRRQLDSSWRIARDMWNNPPVDP